MATCADAMDSAISPKGNSIICPLCFHNLCHQFSAPTDCVNSSLFLQSVSPVLCLHNLCHQFSALAVCVNSSLFSRFIVTICVTRFPSSLCHRFSVLPVCVTRSLSSQSVLPVLCPPRVCHRFFLLVVCVTSSLPSEWHQLSSLTVIGLCVSSFLSCQSVSLI